MKEMILCWLQLCGFAVDEPSRFLSTSMPLFFHFAHLLPS